MRWKLLVILSVLVAEGLTGQSTVRLEGAGGTFPYPLYDKWFAAYSKRVPTVLFHYAAVGSEEGLRRLLAGKVDFAGSDCPVVLHQLAHSRESEFQLLPSVAGAVVPIVNLPGFGREVNFTPEALAGIYAGRITKWNDPALRASNPGLHLPDLDILVVHRSEGSGTSYIWTDFLSTSDPQWKTSVGMSTTPKWPVGKGAKGNDGVAAEVKERGGAIGYVEFIYALKNHLNAGRVRNPQGEFVQADLESIQAAAETADGEFTPDYNVSIVNARKAGAYPIASFTWFVVPARVQDAAKREALIAFLHWMLGPGQNQAASLGFVMVPKDLAARELKTVDSLR